MALHNFALHETMELHEILNFKTVCLTKSETMQLLVSDPKLKLLMQKDEEQSTKAISELQFLLSNAIF
ncbi:MAG: hypothetical protein A4E53_04418 [Pelotomaculum sp. PtaB.Bin104]|nr:MAG: hypothetical protein A4E53_04418 [Pelotomaculum sp. PtaB.Bin104]